MVEIETVVAINPEHVRLVQSILRIYRPTSRACSTTASVTTSPACSTARPSTSRSTPARVGRRHRSGAATAAPRRGARAPAGAGLWRYYIGRHRHRPFQDGQRCPRSPHRRRGAAAAVAADALELPLLHDRLYRFGGEEFVVLMRCGSDEAAWVGSSGCANVQGYVPQGQPHHHFSVAALRCSPGDTPSIAFARADKAVYWAKTGPWAATRCATMPILLADGEASKRARSGDVELF